MKYDVEIERVRTVTDAMTLRVCSKSKRDAIKKARKTAQGHFQFRQGTVRTNTSFEVKRTENVSLDAIARFKGALRAFRNMMKKHVVSNKLLKSGEHNGIVFRRNLYAKTQDLLYRKKPRIPKTPQGWKLQGYHGVLNQSFKNLAREMTAAFEEIREVVDAMDDKEKNQVREWLETEPQDLIEKQSC